jgi:hypothetical protein
MQVTRNSAAVQDLNMEKNVEVAGGQCSRAPGKDSGRNHLLENAPFCSAESALGLKSRARQRARFNEAVNFWTNCALSVIRQLWKGSLNDDLIEASNGQEQWPEVEASANGHSVTSRLGEKI